MIVWTNKSLKGNVMSWKATGGRSLEMYNNTGRMGRRFDNIYLGYKRNGRKYIVSLNKSKHRKNVEKTVGIWISDSDYEVLTNGEMWTGKTAKNQKIIGRFGIYNVGTMIRHEDRLWELKSESGWVVAARIDKALSKARSIIDSEYESLCDMRPSDLHDYLTCGYPECECLTLDDSTKLHMDFFGEGTGNV